MGFGWLGMGVVLVVIGLRIAALNNHLRNRRLSAVAFAEACACPHKALGDSGF
jgi:hypothetical protein